MNDPTRLRIGICCFATYGGSGVVATDVGIALARRGHDVHLIAAAQPVRLRGDHSGVTFHAVPRVEYPVLDGTYPLALAATLVDVIERTRLDVLHVHYAIPHAAAAWMARAVLKDGESATQPPLVTTLHGTDITLVGADPAFLPITRFAVKQSDAVTTPSAALRHETYERLNLERDRVAIDVVPNFVDADRFRPGRDRGRLNGLFSRTVHEDDVVLVHTSNFRPVKRTDDVMATFARVARARSSFLVLIGDGPTLPSARAAAEALGLLDRVCFLGEQDDIAGVVAAADVFLLPSATEGFGLAALEALSCGVPVVASNTGGIPEVVKDGVTGTLCAVGDVDGFAAAVLDLMNDNARRHEMCRRARLDVLANFQVEPAVDRYEAVYRRVLRR